MSITITAPIAVRASPPTSSRPAARHYSRSSIASCSRNRVAHAWPRWRRQRWRATPRSRGGTHANSGNRLTLVQRQPHTLGQGDGVDVCVSSSQCMGSNSLPAMAKAAGNYLSSQLISLEAKRLGFAEGIALTTDGMVSEGGGENLFLVKDGVLLTPALAHSVLGGITRNSVIRLAQELGLEVRECAVPRELLYLADELFFTGTAVEVTPIRSVDRITVGAGKRGPIPERIQQSFFGLFDGRTEDKWGWLDYVDMRSDAKVAAAR